VSASEFQGLPQLLSKFGDQPVVVTGDLMLDQFIWGEVDRISPEAPVPVVKISRESFHLGGAANVASNLSTLGARPLLIGITGRDEAGEKLLEQLKSQGLSTEGVIQVDGRATTVKTRIIAGHQQVCRTDRESSDAVTEAHLEQIRASFREALSCSTGVILSDYAKGVLPVSIVPEFIQAGREAGAFVAVDPKGRDFSIYENASLITPNKREAEEASGVEIENDTSFVEAGRKLIETSRVGYLLITRGEEGMTLFEGQEHTHIPTVAQEVFDVTGAGDTVIASLTLSVVAGASVREAAIVANHAAGVVVGKLGTATATVDEILSSAGVIR